VSWYLIEGTGHRAGTRLGNWFPTCWRLPLRGSTGGSRQTGMRSSPGGRRCR